MSAGNGHHDDRPPSAYLAGEVHSQLELLHRRLLGFPPYRWALVLAQRLGITGRGLVVAIPFTFLLFFFVVPFLIVLKISFSETAVAIPPYTDLIEVVDDGFEYFLNLKLNLGNYWTIFSEDTYVRAYLNSAKIAAISTLLCLGIGFPMAYAMARADEGVRPTLLMLVILPFWTSFLIRVYAWIVILKPEGGVLNGLLMYLGILGPDEPLHILNTEWAMYIGIVYSYLPFMVLPLYANLERMDMTLLEAAADLGCRPIKAFWVVTVPLAIPGIIAGCFLVFIPAVGEYVIPELLAGDNVRVIGRKLFTDFSSERNWPLAAAVSVVLLLILIVPIMLFQRQQARLQEAGQ
ncbi:ABC transporter permease subunit [Oleomonas cavernae]|uniref:ABC transporter permease subunit n=1 Tax=Oleomonas cavernae TaxID=2320859 RepID=A0A418WHV2_9PROT|nr:ABC transporter permease subunit [Oleomonas cavernae]RJF89617.1 ABC transporter permease subunit [Oleomonas cavernae]